MSANQQNYQQPEVPAWRRQLRPTADAGLGDPGPFWCYIASIPVTFNVSDWVWAADSSGKGPVDSIGVGQLYQIRKDYKIEDLEFANGKGEEVFERPANRQGTDGTDRVTNVPTNPADNKRFLTGVSANHAPNAGGSGLTWIESFKGLEASVVRPDLFSRILRPVTFTPDYQETHPDIAAKIETVGALALYREMMEKGFEDIKSQDFVKDFGPELQRLYLSAKKDIAAAYRQATAYFKAMLDQEDANVRQNAAKGAVYSHLAQYGFYMSARKPINMVQGAGEPQKVIVEMANQGQAPATAEDVERVPCPRCAERIPVEAKYCRFCQLTITESAQPQRVTDKPKNGK